MDYYYYIIFIAEFLAAISATVFLYKFKHTRLFLLVPLLWFIPINELVCQYIFPRMPEGYFLKNLYRLLIPMTIIYLIVSQLQKKKNKLFVQILLVVAILFYGLELLQINPLNTFLDISFTAASILIVVALLVYFIEELKGSHHTTVNRNLFLWICFGFLLFNLPYPIIFFARKYINSDNEIIILTLNKIQLLLGILSYLIIALGFYWGNKIEPQSSTKPE